MFYMVSKLGVIFKIYALITPFSTTISMGLIDAN